METPDKVKDENGTPDLLSKQVIHCRGNSDSDLQALFDCVLKPSSQMPLQKPFKMRNLPKSFFTPPSHRQSPQTSVHSRESSTDSTYSSGNPVGPPKLDGTHSPLQVQHTRHHSSPATLQQTLSIAPPISHQKQHSYDALTEDPLPPGWEEARTPEGQIYYLNHNTQSTQWDDPRKKRVQSPLTRTVVPVPQPSPQQQIHLTSSNVPSPNPSSSSSTPVPSPVPPVSVSPVPVSSNGTVTVHQNVANNTNSIPLPQGWEQGVSPDGEIYFINHIDKSTSWFDPRIPRHLQTAAIGRGMASSSVLPSAPAHSAQQQQQQCNIINNNNTININLMNGNNHSPQHSFQNQTLQRLLHEKDKMRYRRQELLHNRLPADFHQRRIRADPPLASETQRPGLVLQQRSTQAQTTQNVTLPVLSTASSTLTSTAQTSSTGDPFLNTNDIHSRQESADSGLGLSNSFTQPHTPEDYLNSMEDIEISTSEEMQQSVTSPMMIGGSELEPMDSEELVSTLNINDDITTEFLMSSDMRDMIEPSKLNMPPTWL